MDLTRIRAVLLDMDGTLVDSDAAVERAWRAWARECGVDPAALDDIHGRPAELTVRRLLPDLDDGQVARSAARQLALQYDDLSDVRAAPGADALLDVLARRRLPWAVVTSADTRLAHARLGAAGIHAPMLVTTDDVTNGKPDPEGYLLAGRGLGITPHACLVVEDSAAGVAAGQAAGMPVAALRGPQGDLALDDLAQLARMLSSP